MYNECRGGRAEESVIFLVALPKSIAINRDDVAQSVYVREHRRPDSSSVQVNFAAER